MMKRERQVVTLGYAPTRKTDAFSREAALENRVQVQRQLQAWGIHVVDLAGINEDQLLTDLTTIPQVVRKFREQGVDAIFSMHGNFGTEDASAVLAKEMGLPLLLWGPQDAAPERSGKRWTDTFCGLFATSRSLVTLGVPFSYIPNCPLEDPRFERGLKNFLGAAAVVKTFRGLRVGQIGVRPASFWSMKCNERELQEKFGIVVEPIGLLDLVEAAKKRLQGNDAAIAKLVERYHQTAQFSPEANDDALRRMAAFHLSVRAWAEEKRVDVATFQCWYILQDTLGIMPCFVAGTLIDEGLPLICEVDIHGAISAAMAWAATMWTDSIFFGDWTVRHPTNPNGVLLWHCGPFPPSLVKAGTTVKVGRHPVCDHTIPGCGHFELKGGPITATRFDGVNGRYSLFFGQGVGCEGPMTQGTYQWMEVGNWPKWEEKLIHGPYVHHSAHVHRHIAPALYEACRYIDGLQPDPVEPTEEEMRRWLSG